MTTLSDTYIIDRIEGEMVVIEVNGDKMQDISKNDIIGSFKEGDVLIKEKDGKYKVDDIATQQRREQIQKKFKALFK